MIIGIDTSAAGKKSTGTSVYINCLLSGLDKTNHVIKTFSPEKMQISAKNFFQNTFPILRRGGIQRHLFRQFQLASLMEKESVDCALFPNYLMPLNYNKPSAIIIHDLSFISHPHFYSRGFVKYYQGQIKRTLRKKPVIVTISEYSRQCINKYLGVDEKEIYLLQGFIKGCETKFIKKSKGMESGSPYFLYVGHIEPRKNLLFLVSNFIEWKKESGSEHKLKLAGEVWSGSAEVQSLIRKFSNHPDVEFLGYVPDEKLKELYSNASAFVHTSFIEGFGFPVLEAMHYGLPVLCSEGSGAEEISKGHSITINPYNGSSLKRGLDKLALQVNEGRQFYSGKYSPGLMDEQLGIILHALEKRKYAG